MGQHKFSLYYIYSPKYNITDALLTGIIILLLKNFKFLMILLVFDNLCLTMSYFFEMYFKIMYYVTFNIFYLK